MVAKERIIVNGIRQDEWVNPFGATPEELVASALDDSGLMQSRTTVNGKSAQTIFQSYCKKKNLFQEATRLGNILLKEAVIQQEQLTEALKVQAETGLPLGEVLISQQLCTSEDIQRALVHQQALREDLYRLEQEKENRKTLWRRIIGFLLDNGSPI